MDDMYRDIRERIGNIKEYLGEDARALSERISDSEAWLRDAMLYPPRDLRRSIERLSDLMKGGAIPPFGEIEIREDNRHLDSALPTLSGGYTPFYLMRMMDMASDIEKDLSPIREGALKKRALDRDEETVERYYRNSAVFEKVLIMRPSELLNLYSEEYQRDQENALRIDSAIKTAGKRSELIDSGRALLASEIISRLEERSPYLRDSYRASSRDILSIIDIANGKYDTPMSQTLRDRLSVLASGIYRKRNRKIKAEEGFLRFNPSLREGGLFEASLRDLRGEMETRALMRPELLCALWRMIDRKGLSMERLYGVYRESESRDFESLGAVERLSLFAFDRKRYFSETEDREGKDSYERYHALDMRLFLIDRIAECRNAQSPEKRDDMIDRIAMIPSVIESWEKERNFLLGVSGGSEWNPVDPTEGRSGDFFRKREGIKNSSESSGWAEIRDIAPLSIIFKRLSELPPQENERVRTSLLFSDDTALPDGFSERDRALLAKYGNHIGCEIVPKKELFSSMHINRSEALSRVFFCDADLFRRFHSAPGDWKRGNHGGIMEMGLSERALGVLSAIEKEGEIDTLNTLSRAESMRDLEAEPLDMPLSPSTVALKSEFDGEGLCVLDKIRELSDESYLTAHISEVTGVDLISLKSDLERLSFAASRSPQRESSSGKMYAVNREQAKVSAYVDFLAPEPDTLMSSLPSWAYGDEGRRRSPDGIGRYLDLKKSGEWRTGHPESLRISLWILHDLCGFPAPDKMISGAINPNLSDRAFGREDRLRRRVEALNGLRAK